MTKTTSYAVGDHAVLSAFPDNPMFATTFAGHVVTLLEQKTVNGSTWYHALSLSGAPLVEFDYKQFGAHLSTHLWVQAVHLTSVPNTHIHV